MTSPFCIFSIEGSDCILPIAAHKQTKILQQPRQTNVRMWTTRLFHRIVSVWHIIGEIWHKSNSKCTVLLIKLAILPCNVTSSAYIIKQAGQPKNHALTAPPPIRSCLAFLPSSWHAQFSYCRGVWLEKAEIPRISTWNHALTTHRGQGHWRRGCYILRQASPQFPTIRLALDSVI